MPYGNNCYIRLTCPSVVIIAIFGSPVPVEPHGPTIQLRRTSYSVLPPLPHRRLQVPASVRPEMAVTEGGDALDMAVRGRFCCEYVPNLMEGVESRVIRPYMVILCEYVRNLA